MDGDVSIPSRDGDESLPCIPVGDIGSNVFKSNSMRVSSMVDMLNNNHDNKIFT